eukprot:8631170-Pyramimonas_sp.AAC.1
MNKTRDAISRLRCEGWRAAAPPASPVAAGHAAPAGVAAVMGSDIVMVSHLPSSWGQNLKKPPR